SSEVAGREERTAERPGRQAAEGAARGPAWKSAQVVRAAYPSKASGREERAERQALWPARELALEPARVARAERLEPPCPAQPGHLPPAQAWKEVREEEARTG